MMTFSSQVFKSVYETCTPFWLGLRHWEQNYLVSSAYKFKVTNFFLKQKERKKFVHFHGNVVKCHFCVLPASCVACMSPDLESLHYIGHTGRQVSHSQAVGCCCYCCQLQSPAVLLVGCLASSAEEERMTRGQFWRYKVFLLFLTREQQQHCKGSLHPPWHPLTAVVSWSATKDTLCITGFCPSSSTPNRKHFRD